MDQTHVRATSYDCTSGSDLEKRMLLITSTECRTIAEKKLAEASCDARHRRQLTNAAEGWLLAGQLRHLEKSLDLTVVEKMPR